MRSLLVIALLSITATATGQDKTLELMRQDIKAEKVAIITASVPMTQEQADAFWPIYREYDLELSKLGDRRVAVIKKFAENYDRVDEKMARELVKESFDIASDRNELLERCYDKAAKAVGAVTAARFIQVENQMLTLLDVEIIDQVPLVKTKNATDKKK